MLYIFFNLLNSTSIEKEKLYGYLDWNVFDKIQKKDNFPAEEKMIYSIIENAVIKQQITVPYSNAHLYDLKRGYIKNPEFIDADLNTLSRLTNNLCIIQYWGCKETIFQTRNVVEFFNSLLISPMG